ncbi:MAG: hypothetical protein ACXAC7_15525 [Candidatus Hodarchaeales archaeon]
MSRSSDHKNLKISAIAWEILRWVKFELDTKSYSDTIISMFNKIKANREKLLKSSLRSFNSKRHKIKVKNPDSRSGFSDKGKTILVSRKARKVLERIKIETGKPDYTYSDSIEFLARESGLLSGHLKRKLSELKE